MEGGVSIMGQGNFTKIPEASMMGGGVFISYNEHALSRMSLLQMLNFMDQKDDEIYVTHMQRWVCMHTHTQFYAG